MNRPKTPSQQAIQTSQPGTMLYVLFVGACIAWVLGSLGRIPLASGAVILPLDIVVGMIALTRMVRMKEWYQQIRTDAVGKYFLLFGAFGGLSLFMTMLLQRPVALEWGQFFNALLYLIRFGAYGQLLWLFPRHGTPSKDYVHRPWLAVILLAGLSMAILGFAQYFLYWDLRNLYYAGWDEHVARLFGTVLDPNYMGALLIVIIALLQVWKSLSLRESLNRYSKILYTTAPMSIVILSVGVVLTYSRSSYLMLGTYALFVYATSLKKVGHLLLIGIVSVLLITLTLSIRTTSEGTNLLRTASIQSRLTEYSQAIHIFSESPIRGVGYNAYRYAQRAHQFLPEKSWTTDHAGAGVPNSYLFILATTGIVGMGIFVKMIYLLMMELKVRHSVHVYALLIALGVHALTENTIFYPFILFPVAVLVSYVRREVNSYSLVS